MANLAFRNRSNLHRGFPRDDDVTPRASARPCSEPHRDSVPLPDRRDPGWELV